MFCQIITGSLYPCYTSRPIRLGSDKGDSHQNRTCWFSCQQCRCRISGKISGTNERRFRNV